MGELFRDMQPSLSPREEWRRKHQVEVTELTGSQAAKLGRFRATGKGETIFGDTRGDALRAIAKVLKEKHAIETWN